MTKYNTKQRKLLLSCLASHADESLNTKQIAEYLIDADISISAVYRNLSALERDGLIKRIAKSGSRESYYQYIDIPECKEHLHLTCKECGKTYHMDATETNSVINSVLENEGFYIDKSDSVLYGICNECHKFAK